MIVLMFHDVIGYLCPASGFQTIGANQYRLDEDVFSLFVELTSEAKNDVVYTFDDGGVSFYQIIAPILERHEKRGIFCITTSYIGKPGFLSAEQIKALDSKGHIIASHSHTHPRDISRLSENDLYEEWSKSKAILENILGKSVIAASVPGGAVSKKVIHSLFKAGFSEIYTSKPAITQQRYQDGIVIGRFAIKRSTSEIELNKILNSQAYRFRLFLEYKVLRVIKALMGPSYNILKQLILKVVRT